MNIVKRECPKCAGRKVKGYLQEYNNIANGVCFQCGGSGYIEVDLYKEERKEKAVAKRLEKRKANILTVDGIKARAKAKAAQAAAEKQKELDNINAERISNGFIQQTADESLKEFFKLLED